jgi:hypothetical protein
MLSTRPFFVPTCPQSFSSDTEVDIMPATAQLIRCSSRLNHASVATVLSPDNMEILPPNSSRRLAKQSPPGALAVKSVWQLGKTALVLRTLLSTL